ncbi:MAG: type II secretion system protein [Desulfurivibrionaceae bacterium]|jgi:MSHA pilin protein MshD
MKHHTVRHTTGANQGFTLVEIVITILLLGAVAGILVPFFNAITHSPDPVIRERAISLGQAMMDEIMAKKWDTNTPMGGGPLITGETLAANGTTCTPCDGNRLYCFVCRNSDYTPQTASSLGLDGAESTTDRRSWDDVDDYNYYDTHPEINTFTDQNNKIFTLEGYSRRVSVRYIASSSPTITQALPVGSLVTTTDTKRVVVTITSPLNETFYFVAVACNI